MASYSAKTWIGISSYNSWFVFTAQNTIGDWDFHRDAFISSYNSWFVFTAQNTIGDWDFHRDAFIVRLSLTAHFHI